MRLPAISRFFGLPSKSRPRHRVARPTKERSCQNATDELVVKVSPPTITEALTSIEPPVGRPPV